MKVGCLQSGACPHDPRPPPALHRQRDLPPLAPTGRSTRWRSRASRPAPICAGAMGWLPDARVRRRRRWPTPEPTVDALPRPGLCRRAAPGRGDPGRVRRGPRAVPHRRRGQPGLSRDLPPADDLGRRRDAGLPADARRAASCIAPAAARITAGRRGPAGFCYLNDPVLGILTWLDAGLDNIVYLDIDAHHGDGVQDAFHDDDRVLTISVHEAGRWPFTGAGRGPGRRRGAQPAGAARVQRHRDALADGARGPAADPRRAGRRRSSCNAAPMRWRKTRWPGCRCPTTRIAPWCDAVRGLAPRLVVTGRRRLQSLHGRALLGRGLGDAERHPDPGRAPRRRPRRCCAALTYNRAAGRNPPEHWFTTMRDAPREGPVRDEVKRAGRADPEGKARRMNRRSSAAALLAGPAARRRPRAQASRPGRSRSCRRRSSSSSRRTASGTISTSRWR